MPAPSVPLQSRQINIHIIMQKQTKKQCSTCPTMYIHTFVLPATTVPPNTKLKFFIINF